ncbi:xanthine dehydrogenase family protein molybdopterin-binding subunit [Trujillonella endophytica]|uniref:Carbon-monoxide dehydrogenase large subunit n=1 Tax=Trujillonella endophytica TaxID=673521 RepID=A0A1H8V562_9ACTN|nr:xanthine dehydrogenase family protein molybdopterin-binding subunit [Trujillella endophytica]SEP10383.1 carbon-monoxide dehydrogenase large subunit [Trujillella endophytica]
MTAAATGDGRVEAGGATRYAGTRIGRVEDPRLLTGRGTYVDDIRLPGMLHAVFVRSPVARGRILGIDASAALALPGVRHVFTAADLNPDVREQWHTSVGPKSPETPRPPLADTDVRFVGDPVALVLADDRYLAEDAAELVEVDYEQLPAVVDYTRAAQAQELVHEAHGSNVVGQLAGRPAATLADVFAGAAHVVTDTIHQQAHTAVPMEGRGMVVDYSASTGELTIHAATQAPHEIRLFCSRLLGLPEHRIRVLMRDTGGGFGQKVMVQRDEMALMLVARRAGAPVKWVEDRRENLLAAGMSRHEHADVSMAFDPDGLILAASIDFVSDCGAYPTPWPVGTSAAVGMLFPGPYRVPAASFTATTVYTNTAGRVAYRGPWQFETLAREVLLDNAAREMGMDPAELRRRNLLRTDELPFANPNGMTYDRITPLETFEQALEMLDYDAFRAEQARAREAGRYLGVGMSTYVEPSTPGYGSYATEAATIRIEPSGKVNVYIAGGSTGNSIETTVVQLTADVLGVAIEDVATIQGDTAVTGFGAGTAGSRSGSMTAGAVRDTATILRERMIAIAAHKLEAAPEDIELVRSRASVRGVPGASVTVAELAATAYFDPYSLPPGVPAGLEASARYTAETRSVWVNAAHVCTCEVDPVTGGVTLLRYIVSEDCGPMINPSVVEGQIAGGTVQGIGGALLEHLAYDEDGNPTATTFVDYLLPTATDVPVIEYGHIETMSGGPGGYKGVGEGGAIGAPPAVVNAVADALAPFGARITRLPLTPESLAALVPPEALR